MNYKNIFETIDELYESYLDVWEDACNIESPSKYKEGVDAVGRYFSALAEKKGWKVDTFYNDFSGNVVTITLNSDSNEKPLIVSGHMDTVQPVGLCGTPAVHRDDQYIYGPGVTDCKGGIIGALLAMDALDKHGYSNRPIKLILQSDEEVSSKQSNKETIKHICQSAQGSVGFLNLERWYPGYAVIVRKGTVTFEFTVTGKEAHAALCAKAGANAVLDAAHKIIELEKLKDHDGITCNVGVISGGSVPNTVPGTCVFKANIRFRNAKELDWVRDYVKSVAATVHVPGCTCTVNDPSARVAMEQCERNEKFLEEANDAFEKCGLPRLEIMKSNGASDAADVSSTGVRCIDSIGVDGGRIHSAEEYAIMESLKDCAKRIVAVALNI